MVPPVVFFRTSPVSLFDMTGVENRGLEFEAFVIIRGLWSAFSVDDVGCGPLSAPATILISPSARTEFSKHKAGTTQVMVSCMAECCR